jgi:hypothetical protein
MSRSKADSYFDAHVDDDPDYRESSEEDSVESDVPMNLKRTRAHWLVEHHDVLSEMYKSFILDGVQLFGGAFFQTGTVNDFAKFVFKHTMPGAN